MADEARTLADVKADADARDTHGLPAPGTPGDPGLQILDATGKGALMRDPKRDPHLAAMLDDLAKAGMPAPKLGDTGVTFEPLMRVRCTQETTYKERYVLPANADPAKCVVPEHVVAGLAHDPLRDASKPCEGIHVLIAEEGDLGTIASVSEDGIIKVVWDGAGDDQPREVLHLDIEPIEHTVEPERPSVIHYPSDGSAQALQASDVGVGLDEALGQGGTFNHLADGSDG